MTTFEIIEKQSKNIWTGSEWVPGDGATLYSAKCSDGYQTVWYEKRTNAEAAGDRHCWPLREETDDPSCLPTITEWLQAGGPMREVHGR